MAGINASETASAVAGVRGGDMPGSIYL
jgi:hypothetical protein